MSTDRRLALKEVAELLGVDEKTVRGWIRKGELRAVDVSRNRGPKRRWRVSPSDLEIFEAKRSNTLGATRATAGRQKARRPQNWVEYV